MTNQIYALLVGVDRYVNPRQAPHLRGCVADVQGTYNWLVTTLGVPENNILLLTSPLDQSEPAHLRPTRANIINGWRIHLAQAGEGDQVFFNYSGHGAQARSVDPNELDGFDETLVAHDSRSNDMNGKPIYDILDKEIATLIQEVEDRGVQVSVFLDCCHSGSGTRAVQQLEQSAEEMPRVRQCLPDLRQRPPSTLLDGLILPDANTRSSTEPSAANRWTPQGNHVLLAGCRDQELANEYRSPETGEWQGATTYFFHKALANYHSGMTWADIHDAVQTHVHNIYAAQSPQLEGPSHLQLLGGATYRQHSYLLITEVRLGKQAGITQIRVNGGVAVGLSVGSQLSIYPPASDMANEAIATATVDKVRADHAWATLNDNQVISHGFDTMQHVVATDALEVQNQVATLNDGTPSAFLKVVSSTDSAAGTPELTVTIENERYVIQDASGHQIVDETPDLSPEGAAQVAKSLEHIAVYRNVQLLRNPTPDGALQGAVTISDPILGYIGRNNKIVEEGSLARDLNEFTVQDGQSIAFTVRNNSSETLYFALFNLDANLGISRYYPHQAPHATMIPGQEIAIPATLELTNSRLTRGKEIFKIFATADPVSFDVLQMPELNQGDVHSNERSRATGSLGQLLDGVRHEGTRPARWPQRDDTDDKWTTDQIEILVMGKEKTQLLTSGLTSVLLDETSNLTLFKPIEFSGSMCVGSLEQTRSAGIEGDLALPPALTHSDASNFFQPVTVGECTRTLGASPLVITLEAEEAQLATITPDNPLQLSLEMDDEFQGIAPIAYDGEFYYVVGRSYMAENRNLDGKSQAVQIDISHLPISTASDRRDGDTASQRGDLKRTLRLFFIKVTTGNQAADIGLRKAQSVDNQIHYTAGTAQDVQNARRIALMVHGINSDTQWLVQKVWPLIEEPGGYDLCLTYDYESIGTGIKENAMLLAESLAALGFGKDKTLTLDIYAHSLGTQISRVLVELLGGDDYVNRVFMGGPPNAGSILAKANALIPWLGALALNFAGTTSSAMMAKCLLSTVTNSVQAINDLAPGSTFYQELNATYQDSTDVSYYIQAGNSEQAYDKFSHLARQTMHWVDGGLNALFGNKHDLVVSLQSASTVRSNDLHIEELPINHYQYFHSEAGYEVLMKWLQE